MCSSLTLVLVLSCCLLSPCFFSTQVPSKDSECVVKDGKESKGIGLWRRESLEGHVVKAAVDGKEGKLEMKEGKMEMKEGKERKDDRRESIQGVMGG